MTSACDESINVEPSRVSYSSIGARSQDELQVTEFGVRLIEEL
jgi:hypothetical protein